MATGLPTTRTGRWSMWFAFTFLVMYGINSLVFLPLSFVSDPTVNAFRMSVLPFWGIAMMAMGAIAGVVALVAIVRQRERSWIVWATIFPLVFVVIFLAGEFLVPH